MFLWLFAVSALAQELDPSVQSDLGEPFFSKPFDGAYGTSGFFDHDPEGTGEKPFSFLLNFGHQGVH